METCLTNDRVKELFMRVKKTRYLSLTLGFKSSLNLLLEIMKG